MIARTGADRAYGWPLILADLALILFLVTLTALAGANDSLQAVTNQHWRTVIAPSQALYRPAPGSPSLTEWLARQPRDPRATLTIFVRYRAGEEDAAWINARDWARSAQGTGLGLRVVMTPGDEADLYASLAYDAPGSDKARSRTK